MFSFKNDYSEGAHPKILEALLHYNNEQEPGYGKDSHTRNAIAKIKEFTCTPNIDVHLMSGGTQTNRIALTAMLRPHEACIAAESAHIAVHEAGAIESSGHKIITVPTPDGKLTPMHIAQVLKVHTDEHMVKPKLVFISNSTELGSIYTLEDLTVLSAICRERDLYLYLDGARLSNALAVEDAGLSLKNICELTDAFYIGGTKNGALLGEALIIRNESIKKDFRYIMKQNGALMAKGRILGIQFETLLDDNLYITCATHANKMATKIAHALEELDYKLACPSPTNQLFPILPNDLIQTLQQSFDFYVMEEIDESHSIIRLVTSWATPETQVDAFIKLLNA